MCGISMRLLLFRSVLDFSFLSLCVKTKQWISRTLLRINKMIVTINIKKRLTRYFFLRIKKFKNPQHYLYNYK